MSCNCSDFGNINNTLSTIQTNFNDLSGNILYNYNQLTRVLSQQSNIINTISNSNSNILSNYLIIPNSSNVFIKNLFITDTNMNINNDIFLSNVITLNTNNGTTGQALLSTGNSSIPIWDSVIYKGTPISMSGIGTIQFTNIPSWVHQISIIINGASTATGGDPFIQVGTSSGYVTSGYLGSIRGNDGPAGQIYSNDVRLWNNTAWASTNIFYLIITFYLINTNTWSFELLSSRSDAAYVCNGAGSITLGSTLDKIRVYTGSGASPDLFDSGSININYN